MRHMLCARRHWSKLDVHRISTMRYCKQNKGWNSKYGIIGISSITTRPRLKHHNRGSVFSYGGSGAKAISVDMHGRIFYAAHARTRPVGPVTSSCQNRNQKNAARALKVANGYGINSHGQHSGWKAQWPLPSGVSGFVSDSAALKSIVLAPWANGILLCIPQRR
jgi:hypothetical protein